MKIFCCCFAEKNQNEDNNQKKVIAENTTQYQQNTILKLQNNPNLKKGINQGFFIFKSNSIKIQEETEATNEIQSQKRLGQNKLINNSQSLLKKSRTLSKYRSKSLKYIVKENKQSFISSNSFNDLKTAPQDLKQIITNINELNEKIKKLEQNARKQSTHSIRQSISQLRQSLKDEKEKQQQESLQITEEQQKQIEELKQWQSQNAKRFQEINQQNLIEQHKKVVNKKERRTDYLSKEQFFQRKQPSHSLFSKKTPFTSTSSPLLKQLPDRPLTLTPSQSPYIANLYNYVIKERYRIENLSSNASKESFGWKILHKSKILTLSVKTGSEYHKEHPFIYSEYFFSGIEGINADIFQYLLYNVDVRKKWDPNLMDLKILENKEDDNSEGQAVYYMANKFPAFFKNRDFIERRVHCYCPELNEHAIIFHQVSDNYLPATKKFVRGYTIIGANFFRQISSSSMQFWSLTQSDLKMSIPQWLVNTFLPSACETWFQKISGLLKEKLASQQEPFVFQLEQNLK